jgi:hypothetical protein
MNTNFAEHLHVDLLQCFDANAPIRPHRRLLGLAVRWLVAGMWSSTAWAGQHSICFEDAPQQVAANLWQPTAVWACHADSGGSCRIVSINGAGTRVYANVPASLPGVYEKYRMASAGTFTATIAFSDGNGVASTRTCTVNASGIYGLQNGWASTGALLTGYTSDSSGLVSTGVWKLEEQATAGSGTLEVVVPRDFVAVGGGAQGADLPYGALIRWSDYVVRPTANPPPNYNAYRTWMANTVDMSIADPKFANPHRRTVYAIGMRIGNLFPSELVQLLCSSKQDAYPSIAAHPSSQVTFPVGQLSACPANHVHLGGTIQASADHTNSPGSLVGQYATQTAPIVEIVPANCASGPCTPRRKVVGWQVASKDHLASHWGTANTALTSLSNTISLDGRPYAVKSNVVMATSPEASHPAVDVSGLRGEYALVGIGASVDWRRYDAFGNLISAGNLLWKLEPRPDLGGVSVASKDFVYNSPATITGYAIGIKLVPMF